MDDVRKEVEGDRESCFSLTLGSHLMSCTKIWIKKTNTSMFANMCVVPVTTLECPKMSLEEVAQNLA